jgi:hypothetical protein
LKGERKGKQRERERRGCRKRERKWKKRKETLMEEGNGKMKERVNRRRGREEAVERENGMEEE